MDPVPLEKRTWNTFNYITYWVSDALSPASWQLASSMLAVGLSWGQALTAIAVGHLIIAVRDLIDFSALRLSADTFIVRHCLERHHWCSSSHCLPRPESIFLWLLVELFQRHQPCGTCHVLVRHSGECFLHSLERHQPNELLRRHTPDQSVFTKCSRQSGLQLQEYPTIYPKGRISPLSVSTSIANAPADALTLGCRAHVLLHLLDHSVPSPADIAAKDSLPVCSQSSHRTYRHDRHSHLGYGEGPAER